MIDHEDTIDRVNADVRARMEQLHAMIEHPHLVVDTIAQRLQPDGLILGRRHQPLAYEVIPARITLDGSLPSCWPQAGPLWRATTPAAPVAPTRETNDMTTTNTPKHEQTAEQTERLWALAAARQTLANKTSAGMLTSPGDTLKASNYKLIELAEWIIGEKPEPEVDEEEPLEQRIHNLIHELSKEQAVEVAMHAYQHSGIPLVLNGELGALADLSAEQIDAMIAKVREHLDALPSDIDSYRERNAFITDASLNISDLLDHVFGNDSVVKAQDGSLTVDEPTRDDAAAEQAADTVVDVAETIEGGDNRTPETDAVVAEHDEQDRS